MHYVFVSDLPFLQKVHAALRAAKGRSAPGPDGTSVDLLRLLKGWAVKQLFAFFFKTAMCRIAPVQYRRGELFELYKGKGTHTLFANFRSILLSDCVGKISSRSYRSAAIPQIATLLTDEHTWQCGGIPGLGTEFPVLSLNLLQSLRKA